LNGLLDLHDPDAAATHFACERDAVTIERPRWEMT